MNKFVWHLCVCVIVCGAHKTSVPSGGKTNRTIVLAVVVISEFLPLITHIRAMEDVKGELTFVRGH